MKEEDVKVVDGLSGGLMKPDLLEMKGMHHFIELDGMDIWFSDEKSIDVCDSEGGEVKTVIGTSIKILTVEGLVEFAYDINDVVHVVDTTIASRATVAEAKGYCEKYGSVMLELATQDPINKLYGPNPLGRLDEVWSDSQECFELFRIGKYIIYLDNILATLVQVCNTMNNRASAGADVYVFNEEGRLRCLLNNHEVQTEDRLLVEGIIAGHYEYILEQWNLHFGN